MKVRFNYKGDRIEEETEKKEEEIEKCSKCEKIRTKNDYWVGDMCSFCYCKLLRKEKNE